MRIYYLYNSGFALITGDIAVVIDYYQDVPSHGKQGLSGGTITVGELGAYKHIYVLASHAHPDHFNPVVLGWQKELPGAHYIFSRDIQRQLSASGNAQSITFLDKGQSYADERIAIKAYGSTDEGISFHLSVDGFSIFHAGDLNCWHWPEESTRGNIRMAIADFEREMAPVIREVITPDIAFFPVDPRMVSDYDRGALYFAQQVRPRLFVPMHFMGSLNAPAAFADKLDLPDVRVWRIQERGEYIDIYKEETL